MRHFDTDFGGKGYEGARLDWLQRNENPVKDGELRRPYIHDASGHPTLGFGFDLRQRENDIPAAILYAFKNDNRLDNQAFKRKFEEAVAVIEAYAKETKIDIDNDGNKEAITAKYLYNESDKTLAPLRTSPSDATRLFNYTMDIGWDGKPGGLEARLTKSLGGTALPESHERIVLLDYSYLFGSLNKELRDAAREFASSDSPEARSEVFYQIRFNYGHPDQSGRSGTKKGEQYISRMEKNSDKFGLVGEGHTDDDIKDAVRHIFDNESHYEKMFSARHADVTKAFIGELNEVADGLIDRNFRLGDAVFGGKQGDTLSPHAYATSGGAVIFAGGGKDKVVGSSRADSLFGEGQGDELNGGGANDFLFGGAGNDVLFGGRGNDSLDGGSARDIAEFSGFKFDFDINEDGGTSIVKNRKTGERDVLTGVEYQRFDARDLADPFTARLVGHSSTALPSNDDGFVAASLSRAFEDGLNFFGTKYETVFVNNNGNVTFGSGLSSFTPGSIGAGSGLPIIAPFWADVDTRSGGGSVVYGYSEKHDSFVVTWSGVDYFNALDDEHVSKSSSFQLEIIDQGAGDAEIVFRYKGIGWTTGDASGGSGGLGGVIARAGINSGNAEFQFELPQSGNQSGMLSLAGTAGNTGKVGVWRFSVHNGVVDIVGEDPAEGNVESGSPADWLLG